MNKLIGVAALLIVSGLVAIEGAKLDTQMRKDLADMAADLKTKLVWPARIGVYIEKMRRAAPKVNSMKSILKDAPQEFTMEELAELRKPAIEFLTTFEKAIISESLPLLKKMRERFPSKTMDVKIDYPDYQQLLKLYDYLAVSKLVASRTYSM